MYCSNCGQQLQEDAAFCTNCGQKIAQDSAPPTAQEQAYDFYNAPVAPNPPVDSSYYNGYNSGSPGYYSPTVRQPVQPVNTGGLIAWSIVTILLCTIPGIVALIKATSINSSASYEAQQNAITSCKTWNTVGTILGILALVVTIVFNYYN